MKGLTKLISIMMIFVFLVLGVAVIIVFDKNHVEVVVPILMFHDVKSTEGGTWSISEDNFRKTLEFLTEEGYTPVSFEQLTDFVEGKTDLPEHPVCITFDDGYYSNYEKVLPIVEEMGVPITVFMTCGTVREEGTAPITNEYIICKMSKSELEIMEASPFVSIQSHTYALHGANTSYSDKERNNSLPLKKESKKDFKEIFASDCELAEDVLTGVGVSDVTVFSYPSGLSHRWSEAVLRDRGYRVTITTDYGHRNIVKKGYKESLYLLGRMNVNDMTTKEEVLKYLERD